MADALNSAATEKNDNVAPQARVAEATSAPADAPQKDDPSAFETEPAIPALNKGKGKAKAVEPETEEEEDEDEDSEEEEDDDDVDEDLDALIEEVDVNEIIPPSRQRSARSKQIDYSSAEAMQKAGVAPMEAAAAEEEEEDDGTFQAADESMEDGY